MEKTKVKKLVTSAITLSMAFSTLAPSMVSVSYTHLDVYKRQIWNDSNRKGNWWFKR